VHAPLAEITGPSVEVADNLDELLAILPQEWVASLRGLGATDDLLELVFDLGRLPEVRYRDGLRPLASRAVDESDLAAITARLGPLGGDNRAGIERTLHRISALRNRRGDIVGLTCRVGRAVYGTIEPLRDVFESGRSVLLVGRPGVGKTTLLREAARVLADDLGRRVMVVDTSNEIGGDGDIPHPGIGSARRIQVPSPEQQHAVMIEAVENHMPEVVVIDEIGTEAEALAARTIAERGVQLVATAHGNTLDNLIANPTLSDLVGGVQTVTLGDDEARRRRSRKTVLERKAPPTFDVVVEIQERDRYTVHEDVAAVVDRVLRGGSSPEEARRGRRGDIIGAAENGAGFAVGGTVDVPTTALFAYAISRDRVARAIAALRAPAVLVDEIQDAQMVLTTRAFARKHARRLRDLAARRIPIYEAASNSPAKIEAALRRIFGDALGDRDRDEAMREVEAGIASVLAGDEAATLAARGARTRRLQHEVVEAYGLSSESVGREPHRRVVIRGPGRRR